MTNALLISTYNWPGALDLVLQSVEQQTVKPNEILIADDGSGPDTQTVIDKWKTKSGIPIKHFWQEDNGFRKTIIMNKAIAGTDAEYIIQIDGDILLHPNFIKDHLTEAKKGFFLNGSRSLISETNTEKLLLNGIFDIKKVAKGVKNRINATRIPFFAKFFRKDHFKSNNVKGCNFSFWRKDFLEVNGYNNEMNGWGHEDIELAARMTNLGLRQRRLKMRAVCFHLHHTYNDRGRENENFETYEKTVREKIVKCKDGYRQTI